MSTFSQGVALAAVVVLAGWDAARGETGAAAADPIDLATALRLAGAQNTEVEFAREKVREAQARFAEARMKYLPWIEPGLGYRRHEGAAQEVRGGIIDADKQSLALGASVAIELDVAGARYASLAARQRVRAAEAQADADTQEAVFAAAAAYFELARSRATRSATGDAVRLAEDYAGQVVRAVEAGLAFQGDRHRAEVRVEQCRVLQRRAEEQEILARARLARVLRLPAAQVLEAAPGELAPLSMTGPVGDLVDRLEEAGDGRPELRRLEAEHAAAGIEALARRQGPWIPTLAASAYFGGLGGGAGESWDGPDSTADYAVGLRWRLGPGGILDGARVRTAESMQRSAEVRLQSAREDIVQQVIAAHESVRSLADQILHTQRALASAEAMVRDTLARREFGIGAVMEAVVAQEDLIRLRVDYLARLAAHNTAQFQLRRATGSLR